MDIFRTIKNIEIPNELRCILENSKYFEMSGGKSGMVVYKLVDENTGETYLLKCADNPSNISELNYEVERLKVLEDKDFTPNTYYYISQKDIGLSLREYIEGKPIHECGLDMEDVVRICGDILRQIHHLSMDPNELKTHNDRTMKAKYNVNQGLVDVDDFEDEYKGNSSTQLFDMFSNMDCILNLNTFSHGDFNFPNIIYSDSGVKVIDWGGASISDIYSDISLIIRGLYDYSDEMDVDNLIRIFMESYGISKLNKTKLKYFILLDEFL